MNLFRVILKEFKLNYRNLKANTLMVLFPIVLIAILGAAFTNVFDQTIKLGEVKVLYTEVAGNSDQTFTNAFGSFRDAFAAELGMTFEKTEDVAKGMESIKDYEYSAYVQISDEPREIKLYKNERYGFSGSLLESALDSFTKTYGAVSAIAVNNPSALQKLQGVGQGSYVEQLSLDKERQPGSLDYYAVTMLTMILLYASLTGFYSVREDVEQMTGSRILCAPVKKYQLLTGKVLGCIVVTVVQGLIVILFSKFILKAYWGEDMATVAMLLLAHSIMAVSMGVGLAYLFRNGDAAAGAMNAIVPIFVFLGGGYVPLDAMGPAFSGISSISPIKWINSALFRVIYNNDYSQVAISIGISLSVAATFIVIAAVFSRRGTGKYA